jgi:hypothetical protein
MNNTNKIITFYHYASKMARTLFFIGLCFITQLAFAQLPSTNKAQTTETYTIDGDDGPVQVKVKRVDGAIIYGGDMVLQPKGISSAIGIKKFRRWNNGIIPYKIASNHPYRSQIQNAINTLNSSTVLWYREATSNDNNYVSIIRGSRCYSGLGVPFWGSSYELSIGDGCTSSGTIIHELLHAAGLFHEHQRFDRDNYVKIIWDNIIDAEKDQFEKPSKLIAKNIGSYNFQSVMQYKCTAFSNNGDKTIQSSVAIGQRVGLSQGDVDAIRSMYYDISSNRNKPIFPVVALPTLTYPDECIPVVKPPKPQKSCEDLRSDIAYLSDSLNERGLDINTRKAILKSIGRLRDQLKQQCK